jgi:hypothetical protein
MKRKMDHICPECSYEARNTDKVCYFCGNIFTDERGVVTRSENVVDEVASGKTVNMGSDAVAFGQALKQIAGTETKDSKREALEKWKENLKKKGVIKD